MSSEAAGRLRDWLDGHTGPHGHDADDLLDHSGDDAADCPACVYWGETMRAVEAAREVLDERDEALRLLGELVDHEDSPCRFDHHGACQEHGSSEGPCTTAAARTLLDAARDERGGQ